MEEQLKIRIDELTEEGISLRCDLPVEWARLQESSISEAGGPGVRLATNLAVDLWIYRSKENVFIRGSIATTVQLECARCLKEFELPISNALRMTFCPARGIPLEKEVELTPEDLEFNLYTGNEIDLGEVIYQEVLLSMPMKPLCREDCRGLCPRCGQDLNTGECPCPKLSGNFPFSILKGTNF